MGECKWRGDFDETSAIEAIEALEHRSELLKGFSRRHFVLFTREAASAKTQEKARDRHDLRLVALDELYAGLKD